MKIEDTQQEIKVIIKYCHFGVQMLRVKTLKLFAFN